MHKELKDKHFVKKPVYPGGLKAMRALIHKELKYPRKALEAKIEGTVFLRYEIGHKGNVLGSKILSSLGHGCDEEAQRVVSKLKFEVPKIPYKMKIKFHKTIKIKFKLPKEKPTPKSTPKKVQPAPKQQRLTYTVVPSQTTPKPEKKSGGYSYTINY